jgi:hypothetical protein
MLKIILNVKLTWLASVCLEQLKGIEFFVAPILPELSLAGLVLSNDDHSQSLGGRSKYSRQCHNAIDSETDVVCTWDLPCFIIHVLVGDVLAETKPGSVADKRLPSDNSYTSPQHP